MWQIYGEKETCGTKGGLVSGKKQSIPTGHDVKSVSNNEWREVSRSHSSEEVPVMGTERRAEQSIS